MALAFNREFHMFFKIIVLFLLPILMVGCSSNPYLDPAQSDPHANFTVGKQMGIFVNSTGILIQQINGKDTNHPGRWSTSKFRIAPGRNFILVSIHGGFGIVGFSAIDFVAIAGQNYVIESENKEVSFEIRIRDSNWQVVFEKEILKEYVPPTPTPIIIVPVNT